MTGTLILGAQWGDEGKAKAIDYLADRFDCVVRYQGGHNAGHTVVQDGKTYVFHLVPSAALRPRVLCAIGNGAVIDPAALLDELEFLDARGVSLAGRLLVSDRAHVILPFHGALDKGEEAARGDHRLGTTGRGIGPAYQDKVARRGVTMADLSDPAALRAALTDSLGLANFLLEKLYRAPRYSLDGMVDRMLELGRSLAPFVCDLGVRLREMLGSGQRVLFEGAQGFMLDLDHGTYPFVTSSSPGPGGVLTGLGLPARQIGSVLGVSKAYCTRVGEGPFPSELDPDAAGALRQAGREFGATTGRPRRVGWLDLVALRYAVQAAGIDALVITKLDVLDDLGEIGLVTAYRLDGSTLATVPAGRGRLAAVDPVTEMVPGWERPCRGVTRPAMLPVRLSEFLARVEAFVGCPVAMVSTGPDRKHTVVLKPELLPTV